MGKRGNRRKRGDARLRVVSSDEAQQRVEVEAELQPLMQELRTHMRDEDPMGLLAFVSSLVAATDGRHGFPDHSAVALDDLVDSFIDIDLAETTAALHVLAAFAPTDVMRARIASTLERRRQPMPRWLADLSETTVTEAARIGYPGEPGQNFLVEHRWPGGDLATYVVYDEGLGRGVKDAFPTPMRLADLDARMRENAPGGAAMTFHPMDLATTRATIEQGLVNGAGRPVDDENETWPAGRPLVEWLITLMPAGGTPHPSTTSLPDFSDLPRGWLAADVDPDDVAEEFAASDEAAAIGFDIEEVHDEATIMAVVEFGWQLGMRDPLDWDPERVIVFLGEYLPSTVLPDPQTAQRFGPVLEAYLRWAAPRAGRTGKERAALLRAARAELPDYLEVAQSPQALALRQALVDYEDLTEMWDDLGVVVIGEGRQDRDGSAFEDDSTEDLFGTTLLESLARHVGGQAALEALDDRPLPDEELDLSDVPTDTHDRVREVQSLVDAFADQSFGVELRTAARRFLARAAAGDPAIFRRASRAETAAAAVTWVVARGNRLVGTEDASMTVRELMDFFGVKGSPTNRAQVFLNAVDTSMYTTGNPILGAADLLVSSNRSSILGLRDRANTGLPFGLD
ncbi:MAG: DUF6398 domain-containing protein [Intrasporangium sp.]|uniref:DUF6398 domain-containing protein n=1 Tax=Intrasporangium sp. TaxID=1925024 RepID=UPI002648FE72|nr:DUF6398 domain-containing protein [Intrasporangium sp.]MDN5795767.1 DUF6398 domain-containing protein [Intrasporangium sp.]